MFYWNILQMLKARKVKKLFFCQLTTVKIDCLADQIYTNIYMSTILNIYPIFDYLNELVFIVKQFFFHTFIFAFEIVKICQIQVFQSCFYLAVTVFPNSLIQKSQFFQCCFSWVCSQRSPLLECFLVKCFHSVFSRL